MSDGTDPETKPDNLIIGPWSKDGKAPAQSPEEVYRRVAMFKTTRIDEVTEEVVLDMFENLFGHAYDFSERNDVNKDVAFLIESLKSILCRHDGLEHPFHKLADKYFVADVNGDLTFTEQEDPIHIEINDGGGC